jgi:hypothetical protein
MAAQRLYLCLCIAPASKNQVNPARSADKGAISAQTSPLPSVSLSYPSPTPNSATPLKRVIVGRSAARKLRLRPCITSSSKNQVQASSACRQGSDFSSHFATALWLSLLPATHPRPRYSTNTSRRRLRISATTPSLSVPSTCKQESSLIQLGVPTRGRFQLKPRHCPLSLSRTRHPPKTQLLPRNGSLSAVWQREGTVFVGA